MRGLDRHLWTPQQRGVLCAILLMLSAVFAVRLIVNNQIVPERLADEGPRAGEVASQLDLNTADAAALSAIPRLGEVKAQAIVAYREKFVAANPGKRAFEEMETLYRVKGIGPSTMELLRQYTFISKRPTTRP
jgi:competence protein ComEA